MRNHNHAPGPKRPTLSDLNAEVKLDDSHAPSGRNVWAHFPGDGTKCIGRLAPPIDPAVLNHAEPYYARNLDRDRLREDTGFRYVLLGVAVDALDGSPLYWSNEDGWVDLSSATVFTEAEVREFDLPEGACDWVALPKEAA